MENRIDLRVLKTQNALIHALESLLAEKSYDDITVAELCGKAQTRKATFYKHFADKDDLFTFMIQSLQESYESEHEKQYEDGDLKSYYAGIFSYTLDFMENHETMVHEILEGKSKSRLMDLLTGQVRSDLQFHLWKDCRKGLLPFSPEYLASIFSGALIQAGCYWMENKNKLTKDEAIAQFVRIVSKVYEN